MEGYLAIDLLKEVALRLSKEYPEQEISALQKLLFEKVLGLSPYKIYLNPNLLVTQSDVDQIFDIVSQLKIQKPIQYILGEADFFGMTFKVTPDVLIPRQETEELVDWVIKLTPNKNASILDIGTGSGCIAISLAAKLPKSHVTAIDISPAALEIAHINALRNHVRIDLCHFDILSAFTNISNAPFDIIVSNPPYVRDSEKALMKSNVLDHEPHLALFVSDKEPLTFYNAIAEKAKTLLNPEGFLYCEINEALANETQDLFVKHGFTNIEVRDDLNGKPRMIRASHGG